MAEHDEARIQVGATWILKRWHDEGALPVERSVESIVRILKKAAHWEVRLHLLQILADHSLPARSITALQKLLPTLLADDNKLVRAWAISVLAATADQRKALRHNVDSLLREAENDEAASVRARVRQIRKRYKWLASTA
ncbi:HEAT repeat domain-containing protein [Pseudobythopirellula maris]|uniref:HEAT repeat domain-containing protein n=1 Tax=Pseudobythopirellula maris TaxID=2527991 RepID=UPI0011B4BE73|nr:HEAT repeat domain-containing protein [Pseudobythopirellula maris]